MKKSILFLLVTLVAVLLLAAPASAGGGIVVSIDGQYLMFEEGQGFPTIVNGTTLIPLRAIFEGLGAQVDWNGDTQSIYAIKGDREVWLTLNEKLALLRSGSTGTKGVDLTLPPTLIEGSTYVPLRFVSESLGCTVDYQNDGITQYITINSAKDTMQGGSSTSQPTEEVDKSEKGYYNETINSVYIDYDENKVVAFPFKYDGRNASKLTKKKYYGGGSGTKVYFSIIGAVENLTLKNMIPPEYDGWEYREAGSAVLGDGSFKDVLTEIEYEEKGYNVKGRVTGGELFPSEDSLPKNYMRISFDVRYDNHLEHVDMDLQQYLNVKGTAKPLRYPDKLPF